MSTLTKGNEKLHTIGSTNFCLDRRYGDLKEIGRGSYGVVCSATDYTLGKRIAIKRISPMAKHTSDAKHVLREIRLMRHMGKHENVVTLEDLIVRESADELYIVMELLDSDLHRVLQSQQVLTESHFRFFMHQLLCGVKYLHDNRIIHRDLKPGNLLVTRDCKLRITDFGLARERPTGSGDDPDSGIDIPMTEHVVTRWYRPPELMLCPDGLYTYAVDMWSCGCILAEMLGRKPIFPGKNFVHQLSLIFDVIGSPKSTDVDHIRNAQAKKFLESQVNKTKKSFSRIYPDASDGAIDLLEYLLLFSPDARIGVDSALASPYISAIVDTPSLVFPDTSMDFEFTFEKISFTKFQLKQMILNEVQSLKKQKALAHRVTSVFSGISYDPLKKEWEKIENSEEEKEKGKKDEDEVRKIDRVSREKMLVQSPSRKNTVAMERLSDKSCGDKAMSCLSPKRTTSSRYNDVDVPSSANHPSTRYRDSEKQKEEMETNVEELVGKFSDALKEIGNKPTSNTAPKRGFGMNTNRSLIQKVTTTIAPNLDKDRSTRYGAAASAGAGAGGTGRKKLTVAQSPKFQKMSWQSNGITGHGPPISSGYKRVIPAKEPVLLQSKPRAPRATSAPRDRQTSTTATGSGLHAQRREIVGGSEYNKYSGIRNVSSAGTIRR